MDVDFDDPCTSGTTSNPRKRKQPDGDNVLLATGPLTEDPIENEYEHLDDDLDEEDSQAAATNLRKSDFEQILRAQEPATLTRYDDIKVTPFNLEEELEEGEFDQAGNFIFKRQKEVGSDEDGNDTWAESVDWAEIERKEREKEASERKEKITEPATSNIRQDAETASEVARDKISCYKDMLRIMKPDESVKKTIQRLGQSIPKRKPMNKNALKLNRNQASMQVDPTGLEEARKKLDLMIELAHLRLQDGDMDIYEKSYEDLEEAIN